MRLVWDEAKNIANRAKHDVDFSAALRIDWQTAMLAPDGRKNYGEDRYICVAYIDTRLHVAVCTPRGDDLRVISLRKANQRERARYEQTWKTFDRRPEGLE